MEKANRELKQFLIDSQSLVNNRLKLIVNLMFNYFCKPTEEIEFAMHFFILQNILPKENLPEQTCIFFKDIVINIDFFQKIVENFIRKVVLSQDFAFNVFKTYFTDILTQPQDFTKLDEYQEVFQLYKNYIHFYIISGELPLKIEPEKVVAYIHWVFECFKGGNKHYTTPSFTSLYPKFIKHDENGNRVYDMGSHSLHNGCVSENVFSDTHSYNTFKMLFQD